MHTIVKSVCHIVKCRAMLHQLSIIRNSNEQHMSVFIRIRSRPKLRSMCLPIRLSHSQCSLKSRAWASCNWTMWMPGKYYDYVQTMSLFGRILSRSKHWNEFDWYLQIYSFKYSNKITTFDYRSCLLWWISRLEFNPLEMRLSWRT